MNVIIEAATKLGAPIYTVHDNFITTATYAKGLPNIYSGVFKGLHSPLELINKLIHINLLKPTQSDFMGVIEDYIEIKGGKPLLSYYLVNEQSNKKKPNCYHPVSNPIRQYDLEHLLCNLIPK